MSDPASFPDKHGRTWIVDEYILGGHDNAPDRDGNRRPGALWLRWDAEDKREPRHRFNASPPADWRNRLPELFDKSVLQGPA